MNILLSGGTGLVGKALVPVLQSQGHQVANLTTREELDGVWENGLRHSYWNPARMQIKAHELEWANGVINLAGYSVANRWTNENKNRMIASRIDSTELLVSTIMKSPKPPKWFLSAGAIGYYRPSDEWQDETAKSGSGFLAELCDNWEDVSRRLDDFGVRRVIVRIGVVLDPHEGALKQMLPLFRSGIGAPVGSGKQWMSWIHLYDLVQAIAHLANHEEAKGIYNAVAPSPVTNKAFSDALSHALGKRNILPPVPAFMLKLMFGEMASMVLASQRIRSEKLQSTGFSFAYPEINQALMNLLRS